VQFLVVRMPIQLIIIVIYIIENSVSFVPSYLYLVIFDKMSHFVC